MFPGAAVLSACALMLEGDGRPALYVAANSKTFRLHLYRVPEDARVSLEAPRPLPTAEAERRGFPMKGSRVIFETDRARTVLTVNTVSVARELLEALEAYRQAVRQTAQGAA